MTRKTSSIDSVGTIDISGKIPPLEAYRIMSKTGTLSVRVVLLDFSGQVLTKATVSLAGATSFKVLLGASWDDNAVGAVLSWTGTAINWSTSNDLNTDIARAGLEVTTADPEWAASANFVLGRVA